MEEPAKCFVCSHTTRDMNIIQNCRVPYSLTPYKKCMAQLLGPNYNLNMNMEEKICIYCRSLLDTRDKLQKDLKIIEGSLLGHLKLKFLTWDEQSSTPPNAEPRTKICSELITVSPDFNISDPPTITIQTKIPSTAPNNPIVSSIHSQELNEQDDKLKTLKLEPQNISKSSNDASSNSISQELSLSGNTMIPSQEKCKVIILTSKHSEVADNNNVYLASRVATFEKLRSVRPDDIKLTKNPCSVSRNNKRKSQNTQIDDTESTSLPPRKKIKMLSKKHGFQFRSSNMENVKTNTCSNKQVELSNSQSLPCEKKLNASPKKDVVYTCNSCKFCSIDVEKVKTHVCSITLVNESEPEDSGNILNKSVQLTFQCKYCKFSSTDKYIFKIHQCSKKIADTNKSNVSVSDCQKEFNIVPKSDFTYQCKLWKNSTGNMNIFNTHFYNYIPTDINTNNKFKCNYCNFITSSYILLTNHHVEVHSNINALICPKILSNPCFQNVTGDYRKNISCQMPLQMSQIHQSNIGTDKKSINSVKVPTVSNYPLMVNPNTVSTNVINSTAVKIPGTLTPAVPIVMLPTNTLSNPSTSLIKNVDTVRLIRPDFRVLQSNKSNFSSRSLLFPQLNKQIENSKPQIIPVVPNLNYSIAKPIPQYSVSPILAKQLNLYEIISIDKLTKTLDDGTLNCFICNKNYVSKEKLNIHLLNHVNEKHSCRYCKFNAPDIHAYLKHLMYHVCRGQILCIHCGLVVSNIMELKKHMNLIHGFKSTCKYCGEQFPNIPTLTDHKMSHLKLIDSKK